MQPESRKNLQDILDAIHFIQTAARLKSLSEFETDRLTREAIYWNFAMIGEWLNKLDQKEPMLLEKITDWEAIISFRNRIVHGYVLVQHSVTWSIIQDDLPELISDIEYLLKSA